MAGDSNAEGKPPCQIQQELMAAVQEHLIGISQLTREVADALARGDEKRAAELDRQVDVELGTKERAMGALHQHRKDHTC